MSDTPDESHAPAQPPPLPVRDQPVPYATQPPTPSSTYTDYDRITDTLGLVPNVRGKDNLQQLAAGGIGMVIGAIAGLIGAQFIKKADTLILGIIGAVVGLFVGVVLFGIWLTIRGLIRASKSK